MVGRLVDFAFLFFFSFSCAKSVRRGGCWLPAVLGRRRMVGNSEGRKEEGELASARGNILGSLSLNTFKMGFVIVNCKKNQNTYFSSVFLQPFIYIIY